MADYILLPATTYEAPTPQARRGPRAGPLNPIIEEIIEESRDGGSMTGMKSRADEGRRNAGGKPIEQSEQFRYWLSPVSDHFPTPRGMHFLAAPILPATPSCVDSDQHAHLDADVDDASSDSCESGPSTNTNAWTRQSVATDATEFDIYDVSDEEQEPSGRKSTVRARTAEPLPRPSSRGPTAARAGVPGLLTMDARKVLLAPLAIPEEDETAVETGMLKKMELLSAGPLSPPGSRVALSPAAKSFMDVRQRQDVPAISAPPSLDGSLNSDELTTLSAPPTPVIGIADDNEEDWQGVRLQPGALETLQALSGSESASEGGEHEEFEDSEQRRLRPSMESSQEMSETRRKPPPLVTTRSLGFGSSDRFFGGLTKLDIPSPDGFFSKLSSASRQTWQQTGSDNDDNDYDDDGDDNIELYNVVAPATSTTAEQFYKTPWARENLPAPPTPPRPPRLLFSRNADRTGCDIVEQVVELPDTGLAELPTAIRIQPTPQTARRMPPLQPLSPTAPAGGAMGEDGGGAGEVAEEVGGTERAGELCSPVVATEIMMRGSDTEQGKKQQSKHAEPSHLERTELWLVAQRAYLQGVAGFSEDHDGGPELAEPKRQMQKPDRVGERTEEEGQVDMVATTMTERAQAEQDSKKMVRFSEATVQKDAQMPRRLPVHRFLRQDSTYYRAFADFVVRSHPRDVFMHRLPRFEALQAQRVALGGAHRSQLLGKYQLSVVPQSAKKRMSANVARGDDELVDDPEKLRNDREAEALTQMAIATWHVAATKLAFGGGGLMAAPVAKQLARQSRIAGMTATVMRPDISPARERTRILDLAGVGTCDWAWHAALQYPSAKVYTVTTKAMRQLSNSNIRGPPNHRQVAVERLTRLPFADGQFDLVSARELHAALKLFGENGVDEWDACLSECLRVLKPGGYLEFSVLDADVMNAGPLGNKKAVEFSFALQTLGYDPSPTRSLLARLHRAGFADVRRAWMFLPMGPHPVNRWGVGASNATTPASGGGSGGSGPSMARDSTGQPVSTLRLEAMVLGSTDNVAAVTGLAAGWSWERWLLHAEMERIAGELRLADIADPDAGPAMREASKMIADVAAVVDEGRIVGSGFRMLRGYARKPTLCPLGRMGTIRMALGPDCVGP